MATIPMLTIALANGYAAIGVAAIRISYDNKRRIAQDDEELEALEEEEKTAVYELTEAANGMKASFLIFVHPNVTDVMFMMIDCLAGSPMMMMMLSIIISQLHNIFLGT